MLRASSGGATDGNSRPKLRQHHPKCHKQYHRQQSALSRVARHDILALRLTLTLARVRLAKEPIISNGFNVNCQAKVRNLIHYSLALSSHNIDSQTEY